MAVRQLTTLYRTFRHGLPLMRLKPSSSWTFVDTIEKQVAARGDHPLVRFEDRRVCYNEYNALANRIAHWALESGIQAGEVVALLMQNRPEYLAAWAGLAKAGITTALLNTNLTGRTLGHAIDAADTRRLIVGSECLPNYQSLGADAPEGLEVHVAADPATDSASSLPPGALDFEGELASRSTQNPDPSVRAEVHSGDPLVLIYTSGTTGLPKAAKMSHLRFSMIGICPQIAGFGRTDVMYCALPLYHSAGGCMAVSAVLRSGGTIALRRRFSASQFWDDVRQFEATAFQYIGEFCRYLAIQPQSDDDGDHAIEFAIGNGLRPDIWEDFQNRFRIPRIVEFYGATEGNVAMLNFDNKLGSCGKRPPAVVPQPRLIRYDVESDTHVRSAEGLCIECAPDEVGELVGEIPQKEDTFQGRFEGYTSKAETEKKILRDVRAKGDTWFRTGDLLRCDKRGYFYFVDRIGDTFRWKGENVSTQEVAEAVGAYPGIQLVNVYGVELGADGRAGMAAIVLDDPSRFDGKAFYELASSALPSYATPVFVRLQPEPEITGTFKLRKVDLQSEGYDSDAIEDPLYVRDDSQREYVELTPARLRAVKSGELRV